jgi:lipopolysaccharide transport system ATP-binding protein
MRRVEIEAAFDEIVAFAEIERFIDTPVKHYSTGMYLRLAFAAAVHLDPEILVVDEVLAVGDARFQQKCLARIAAFRAAGRTLVLASHMPEQIKALCDEVLVLDEGQAVMRGTPVEAFGRYDQLMEERTERRRHALGGGPAVAPAVGGGARRGTQEGSIEGVRLQDLDGRVVTTIATGEPLAVELDLRLPAAAVDFALDLGVYSDADEKCFEVLIKSGATTFGLLEERATVRCVLPALPLRPARYLVAVGLYPPDYDHTWDYHSRMHGLLVEGEHADHVTGVVDVHPRWHVVAPVSGPPAER